MKKILIFSILALICGLNSLQLLSMEDPNQRKNFENQLRSLTASLRSDQSDQNLQRVAYEATQLNEQTKNFYLNLARHARSIQKRATTLLSHPEMRSMTDQSGMDIEMGQLSISSPDEDMATDE